MARKVVRWEQEERSQLTRMIHKLRSRHPGYTLVKLFATAQDELVKEGTWSKDRLRNCTTMTQVEWVNQDLRTIDKSLQEAAEELPNIKAKLDELQQQPSREDILATVDGSEAVLYFADKVFENMSNAEIAARLNVERLLENFDMNILVTYVLGRISRELISREEEILRIRKVLELQQKKQKAGKNGKLLKFAVVGARTQQFSKIEQDCGTLFEFAEINKDQLDRTLPHFDGLLMLANQLSESQKAVAKVQAKSLNVPSRRIISVNAVKDAIEELLRIES
jgi:hypothetical protein